MACARAIMVLVFLLGIFAVALDWRLDPIMHQLLGFVLGFLLVIMGNLSNGKYNEAVSAMNRCVQDGTSLCSELLSVLPATAHEEHDEIRRSIVLLFRLMCYEVRADVQARENRNTWLDPDGGVCTPAERTSFFAVQAIFSFYSVERPLGLGELGFSGYLLVLLGFFSGIHLFTFRLLPRILWCWVSLSLSLSFARAFLLGRLINFTQ